MKSLKYTSIWLVWFSLVSVATSAQNTVNLTQASGGPLAAGDPMGLYQSSTMTQLVDYVAFDNHIHQLTGPGYGTCGRQWCDNDLTAEAGATAPGGNPWEYLQSSVQAIVYMGTDSHVYQLYTFPNWVASDLTTLAGAPQAIGDPTGLYWNAQNEQLVVYVANDLHVHQLYTTNNNTKWKQADLTSLSRAPLAGGRPMEYIVGTQQVVVYAGSDGHIYQLYTSSGAWHYADLTSLTNASTESDVFGLYNSSTNQQLLVFLGSFGDIHQLWSNSGSWNGSDLSQAAGAPLGLGNPVEVLVGTEQVVAYRDVTNTLQTLYQHAGSGWLDFGFVGPPNPAGNPFGYAVSTQKLVVYRDSQSNLEQADLNQ